MTRAPLLLLLLLLLLQSSSRIASRGPSRASRPSRHSAPWHARVRGASSFRSNPRRSARIIRSAVFRCDGAPLSARFRDVCAILLYVWVLSTFVRGLSKKRKERYRLLERHTCAALEWRWTLSKVSTNIYIFGDQKGNVYTVRETLSSQKYETTYIYIPVIKISAGQAKLFFGSVCFVFVAIHLLRPLALCASDEDDRGLCLGSPQTRAVSMAALLFYAVTVQVLHHDADAVADAGRQRLTRLY